MDREKQIAEMAVDINDCITEFVTDVGDVYIDDEATAQKMFDKGYRKQSEVAKEIFAEIEDSMSCFEDDDDGYLLKKCEFEFFMRELKKEYMEESGNDR